MALFDRVRAVTTTSGTGPITPGAAVSGYRAFAGAVPDGATVSYVIEEGEAWEIGTGVYSLASNTLTRSLVRSSTGALLSLSGGAQVFISPHKEDLAVSEGLSDIANLTPSNDDLIQRKAGAWTTRSLAQLKTDLAYTLGELGSFSSATLRSGLTDETGSGAAVFANSPALVSPTVSGSVVVSNNVSALPSFTPQLRIANADGVASQLSLESWNAGASIICRRARGSAFNPSGSLLSDGLGALHGAGYGTTGYSTQRGSFAIAAAENWTDSAQGTYLQFVTCQIGTTGQAEKMRLTDAGELLVGTTASSGGSVKLTVAGDVAVSGHAALNGGARVTDSTEGSSTPLAINSGDGSFTLNQEIRVDFQQATATVSRVACYYSGADWGLKFYTWGGPFNTVPTMTLTGTDRVGIGTSNPSVKLDVDGPIKVRSYTVGGVPSVAAGAGQIIFVSNETGGAVLAYSDGANWRRVTDRAVIS